MAKKKPAQDESAEAKAARKPVPIPQHSLALDELDGVLDAVLADQAYNRRNFGAHEAKYRQISLPLPSLCLQYLFGQTGWPLGRTIYLSGPPGGCKTSFMDEIMRWHLQLQGVGTIVDAERKDAPQRRESMMPAELLRRARINEVSSTEGWQGALTAQLNTWRKVLTGTADKPGKGFVMPLFTGVDSIAAVTTESQVADAMVAGHASRGQFGASALIGSEYMKVYTRLSEDMPTTLCLISHEKGEGQDRTTSGGKSPQFHCSYFVDMRRLQFLRTVQYGGVLVKIHIGKNSMGEGNRDITARMVWTVTQDPETMLPVQKTYWDWPTCTTLMLIQQRALCGVAAAKEMDKIVDLHAMGAQGKERYWSKRLGIPEKKPVSAYDIGLMIDQHDEICRNLCTILKIHPHPYFIPGQDFRAQQDTAVAAAAASLQCDRRAMALPRDIQEVALLAAEEQARHRDEITGTFDETPVEEILPTPTEAKAGRTARKVTPRTQTPRTPTTASRPARRPRKATR